jgi:hydrogenase expression/formation protein HypE
LSQVLEEKSLSKDLKSVAFSCPIPETSTSIIKLGHGSGGKMTASLIENIFLPKIGNDILNQLDDAAVVAVQDASLAITIDSYVVSPIFFPGGDIGSLAVYGTVNDLAMRGARPMFITASFILEEGFSIEDLQRVIVSMHEACSKADVKLVAADTKVVNKGAADQLFITTSGVGVVDNLPAPAAHRARPGDHVLISGDVGRHGIAIMSCREGLELETAVVSDSCPLHSLVSAILNESPPHALRDITRGGLASVLNEIAVAAQVGIEIDEAAIPLHPQVRAVCEILGLDPLYVACEGRLVSFVSHESSEVVLQCMRLRPEAESACQIGRVVADHPGRVILRSRVGGNRILDKLSGEQLPRIC